MKRQPVLNWLVAAIVVLAIAGALAGLFMQGGAGPRTFTTLHGQTAQIYGRGLYQWDTVFSAATFRAVDLTTLVVSVPLLIVALVLYRRGSLRGALLLLSALPYFLYNAASMTFSAAFNSMFLLYVALLSISLFAFIVAITAIEGASLADRVLPDLPRRGIAIFLFVAGLGTLFIWLSDLIGPLMAGGVPANLGPYTTMFTHGFDSAVITPATIIAGIALLRHKPLGLILAAPLMVFCAQNGLTVIGATISQALEGIVFPMGVYIGMVGSWVVMGAAAIWLTVLYFRNIRERAA